MTFCRFLKKLPTFYQTTHSSLGIELFGLRNPQYACTCRNISFSSGEERFTGRSKMSNSFGIVLGGIFALVVAGYIAQSRLPPPKPKIIGIDLGTTFSCVGVYQAITGHVDILANENGSKVIPSVVAFSDNGVLVGNRALAQAELNPRSTIYDAKRFIGKVFSKEDLQKMSSLYQFKITSDEKNNPFFVIESHGNQTLVSPEEIGASILRELKRTAEKNISRSVDKAVLSVPAEFDMAQRNATIKAASLAGIKVLRLINEPTAAAMAYGLHKKDGVSNVMVVDLGGGTLDVSLLNIQGGMFVTMAMAGNNRLGGQDFNVRLMSYLMAVIQDRFGEELTNAEDIQRVRQEVESAKINLTSEAWVIIRLPLPSLNRGKKLAIFEEKISRLTFEKLNKDLFQKVLQPIERVLKEVELPKEYVDEVVLVGGSTRIPRVRQLIKEYFNGKAPNVSIDPELAVATGVAIQAGIIGGMWPLQVSALELPNHNLKKIHIES